jgi:hypothetical protein
MIISMGRFFLIRIQKKPLIKFDNHLGNLPAKKAEEGLLWRELIMRTNSSVMSHKYLTKVMWYILDQLSSLIEKIPSTN